jgi:hypothetical protein
MILPIVRELLADLENSIPLKKIPPPSERWQRAKERLRPHFRQLTPKPRPFRPPQNKSPGLKSRQLDAWSSPSQIGMYALKAPVYPVATLPVNVTTVVPFSSEE